MAILSRKEQAYIIRVISSLSEIKTLPEIFESLAEEYKEKGMINPNLFGAKTLKDMRKFPLFLRKLFKGYVSLEFRKTAGELTTGKRGKEVLERSELFDEDVKKTLIVAVEKSSLREVSFALAEFLELETKFLSAFNSTFYTFYILLVFVWIFIGIMAFKTIPAFLQVLGSVDKLPPVPKFIYVYFNQHPYFFYLSVGLTILFIYHMATSNWWKVKFFDVFRMFERLKFLSLSRILHPISKDYVELLTFIAQSGLSKPWLATIKEVVKNLRRGISPQKAFRIFIRRKLIGQSEFLFLSAAVEKVDFSLLKNAEELFKTQMFSDLEFTKKKVEVLTLLIGATIIGGLYILILLQLMRSIQQS